MHSPTRLDKALARDAPAAVGLSRSALARLLASGAVSDANSGEVVTEGTRKVSHGSSFLVRLD
eukprot:SAG31_NODE_22633_length_521_cov_1.092417_1_plen_62_part_10